MINKATITLSGILWIGSWMSASADALPIADLPQGHEVLFSRDVAPVLKKNCIACHNASNEEGGVNLESAAQMKSSDVEDVLVPGKPDTSQLFLLASHADQPVMPPEDNDVSATALTPMELALLRRWIESGAVVDSVAIKPTKPMWKPLSPTLQTVYGSAMTEDGRMSAVSFGNQIRLFGAKSTEPLGTLEVDTDNQPQPAHDDFVQDLFLDPTGHHVVSAGFRNVKLWELSPFESASVPAIDHDDLLAIAMDESGSHLAVLSRRGELSVAAVGSDRWQWMKSSEVPNDLTGDNAPKFQLAVGATGQEAAIAWGNTIRIVRIDGKAPETIETTSAVTSMLWRGNGELATADATGHVFTWKRDGVAWTETKHEVFDQAVLGLYPATQNSEQLVALDVSGKVARWNQANRTFDDVGKMPSPAVSGSLSPDGNTLWVTTAAGTLGQYSIADEKYAEVAKFDPVADAQLVADQWQTLVGEKLVVAHDKEVKQAEANVTAETKSLETFTKEIDTKTKLRDEKQTGVAEAKKATEAAAKKLAESKSTEEKLNQQRNELAEAVKQRAAKISELETQLAKLKAEQADAEKQLAGIPDAKKLADAVKTATEAASKADQAVTTKDSELSSAVDALRLAEQTKVRGETRLKGLKADLQHQQEVLEQVKGDQGVRKSKEATSKSSRDQSRVTDQTFTVMASGTRIVTHSSNSDDKTSGTWSLWSNVGDWLAELPEIPGGGQLAAAGDRCVLIKANDGSTIALKSSDRLWKHRKTIGDTVGESPFADRVLSVDVDRSGKLLATGGGEPSRSGELMIWEVSDGSLVRRFQAPHEDTILCVRFSPDGKTLATGGADRMVKLWDVESGKLIKTLEGHTHHVTALAWNVNRRQLASGSADATVKIWNLDSGQTTRTISGLKTEVTRLVYVGRDDRIGIAGGDSYFRVYRTDNGSRETNAKVLGGYLYALDSNRDGTRFVVGGADGTAVIVDKSGKQLAKYSLSAD